MKIKQILLISLVCVSFSASARDERLNFSVDEAMKRAIAESIIDGTILFYFGQVEHPLTKSSFGELISNKKTNAFNKTDREACEWAFLSAIKTMHKRAVKLGANAVVNVRSYYKKETFSSESEYQCGAGTFVAGVALKGEFVKLK